MCDKVSCPNIVGLVLISLAICAAAVGLILDQITAVIDEDGEAVLYCGWMETQCNEDYEVDLTHETPVSCSKAIENEYEELCDLHGEPISDDDSQTYDADHVCDTQRAGQYWLFTSIAAIVLCVVNIVLLIVGVKKGAMAVGIVASVAFALALIFWVGFNFENFDFEGNGYCWDNDALEDEDIAFGASMFCMMGASVFSLIGAILSCLD